MLIVDASIVVKWFYPEEDSDKAETILYSGKKLIAPEIIRIEVAATFTRLMRTKHINQDMAENLLSDWRDSLIKETVLLEATLSDFESAATISMENSHQLQDCLYVALATRLKAPLITADKKLLKKAGEMSCEIQPLSAIL